MSQLQAIATGVLADLRARRLLPVAAVLLVLVIAVPVVLSKPAEDAPPAKPSAAGASTSVNGLPGPEQALNNDKPLVTLAVLDRPSDLKSYESKNPFKPLKSISSGDTSGIGDGATAPSTGGTGAQPAGPAGDPPGGSGGGPTGGGGTTAPPSLKPPSELRPPKVKTEQFTYVIDLKLRTPTETKSYRKLQRLSLLPSQASPLLIFLGVGDGGNRAVFLVDSTLTPAAGEGRCSPSPKECATVNLEPGERYAFTNQSGGRYELELQQIARVTVKSLRRKAKSSKSSRSRAGARPAGGVRKPVTINDFVPVLVDLVTGGQR